MRPLAGYLSQHSDPQRSPLNPCTGFTSPPSATTRTAHDRKRTGTVQVWGGRLMSGTEAAYTDPPAVYRHCIGFSTKTHRYTPVRLSLEAIF